MPAPTPRDDDRARVVRAACELARSSGPGALSAEAVAEAAGLEAAAVRSMFATTTDLVREAATCGVASMVEHMLDAVRAVDQPDPRLRARERIAALGLGYVRFAFAEPGLFRSVFVQYPDVLQERDGAVLPDPLGMIAAAFDDAVHVGLLDAARRDGAEITAWATAYGVAMLHLDGPLRGSGPEERDLVVEQVLRQLDRGFMGLLPDDLPALVLPPGTGAPAGGPAADGPTADGPTAGERPPG